MEEELPVRPMPLLFICLNVSALPVRPTAAAAAPAVETETLSVRPMPLLPVCLKLSALPVRPTLPPGPGPGPGPDPGPDPAPRASTRSSEAVTREAEMETPRFPGM